MTARPRSLAGGACFVTNSALTPGDLGDSVPDTTFPAGLGSGRIEAAACFRSDGADVEWTGAEQDRTIDILLAVGVDRDGACAGGNDLWSDCRIAGSRAGINCARH